jgi:hypothetical protein
LCGTVAAQTSISPDEVIRRAAANEEKLKAAEADYSYRQDILVQTFGEMRSVTAQLHRLSEVGYDDLGNRVDRIIEYPPSPLTSFLGVQKPDFKSLLGVDPFFLTSENLPRYSVKFVEKQKIDELTAFVYDLEPASQKDGRGKGKNPSERPFKGRIWVDDQDLQIVKFDGRAVVAKDDKEKFPKFEYYREYVDDKFWLPSYVLGDDVLDLKRFDVPIRVTIKYANYRQVQRRR